MNPEHQTSAAAVRPRITLRGIVIAVVIYILYSVLYSLLVIIYQPGAGPFVGIFQGIFLGILLQGILSLIPWYVVIRRMDDRPWPWRLMAHAVLGTLFAFSWHALYVASFLWLFGPEIAAHARLNENKIWLIYGAFIFYVIQFSIIHVIWSAQKLRDRERQAALLRDMARQSELAALKAQIQPHFLFNTLNTISATIRVNPEEAREMIAGLAHLLRYAMNSFQRDFVTLGDEIEFIRTYLNLEQKRFSDRLSYHIDVPPDLLPHPVPPMILQPLVENAVRHGIASKKEGGRVILRIREQDGRISFSIRDTGAGLNGQPREDLWRKGIGLSNTDRRLRHLYGNSAGLVLHELNDQGLEVSFTIPTQYRETSHDAKGHRD